MPHIEHKTIDRTRVAGFRRVLNGRDGIREALSELRTHVPAELVAGPPFCVIQFVTSVQDGYDAEIGVPVSGDVVDGPVTTGMLPAMEVLSLVHSGPGEKIGKSYSLLYGHAAKLGLISDEFCREVYPEWENGDTGVELQFVIHAWESILGRSAARVLGDELAERVMAGSDALSVDSGLDERFRWVKAAVETIDEVASERQRYDIVSSCAHVFPDAQVAKLKKVYEDTKAATGDSVRAVDAVLDFMDADPGWGDRPRREGRIIYSTKKPRDQAAYDKAETDAERRKAYCFCPLVRERLDDGMSTTFCYCGSGWFRRQWEGATGKPVTIEIVRSVLKGDDACEFAVTLSDEI